MTTKKTKRPGRPYVNASGRQRRRNVSLSDQHAVIASHIGQGSVSYGIRIALDSFYDSIEDSN